MPSSGGGGEVGLQAGRPQAARRGLPRRGPGSGRSSPPVAALDAKDLDVEAPQFLEGGHIAVHVQVSLQLASHGDLPREGAAEQGTVAGNGAGSGVFAHLAPPAADPPAPEAAPAPWLLKPRSPQASRAATTRASLASSRHCVIRNRDAPLRAHAFRASAAPARTAALAPWRASSSGDPASRSVPSVDTRTHRCARLPVAPRRLGPAPLEPSTAPPSFRHAPCAMYQAPSVASSRPNAPGQPKPAPPVACAARRDPPHGAQRARQLQASPEAGRTSPTAGAGGGRRGVAQGRRGQPRQLPGG